MRKFIVVCSVLAALLFALETKARASTVSDVFAAYTSDYPCLTNYNARMHPNKVHLCVSFRLSKPSAVKIRWKIEGADGTIKYYAISTDHNTDDQLGELQPGIHNKCLHPQELEPGIYNMTVSVRPRHGHGVKRDRCSFEVKGFNEE